MQVFEFDKVFNMEDYLYVYSPMLTPKTSLLQADFIADSLKLEKESEILDLCCGFGRISNILAQKGYKVTGLDNSADFLGIARDEAVKLNVEVEYVKENMLSLPFSERFDAVINVFTSFGYFSDAQNLQVLKEVSKSLKPKGKFLLDVINRDRIIKNFMPYVVTPRGEDYVVEINSFDLFTSTSISERILFKKNEIKKAKFFVRLYTYTELKTLLSQVGLEIIASFGSYNINEEYNLNSNRMIIIAEKR